MRVEKTKNNKSSFQWYLMHRPSAKVADWWDDSSPNAIIVEHENGSRYWFDGGEGYTRCISGIVEMSESAFKEDFSRRLYRLCLVYHIDQKVLADKIGISEVMMSRYIRGKALPSVFVASKICNTLKCDIRELIYVDH